MKASICMLAAFSLLACDRRDSTICGRLDPRPASPALLEKMTWMESHTIIRTCIEHWSAKLARGSDNASVVARAAVATCDSWGGIDRTNVLGEKLNVAPMSREDWRDQALFIVVQTRAGHCYPDA